MGQFLKVEERIDAQIDFRFNPRTFSDRLRRLRFLLRKHTKVDDKAALGYENDLCIDTVLAGVYPVGLFL
jgi:hypothetical protein